MEQRGLKVLEADKTFFTKITSTISKILIPTKVGINGVLISFKRNNLLKAHENYTNSLQSDDVTKKEQDARKYEEAYSLYLESIDKYIMDSVYKKVKSGVASSFEQEALSKYYTIIHLKENEYVEYKHRKQKYLLELDFETILALGKEKLIEKYKAFYLSKIDSLYKGILKNYSIQLADVNAAKFRSNTEIYNKIFDTLEEYISNVFLMRLEADTQGIYESVKADYAKYEKFEVGKLDERDKIEKKTILIGISRNVFTHSIPLIVAEQCYIKLIKDARILLLESKPSHRAKAYKLLMNIIEEYNVKLLSTKVYWDKPEIKQDYKEFWNKYKQIEQIKDKDEKEYTKQKEVLFLKYDIKKLRQSKKDYSRVIKLYKEKLVEYNAIRSIRNKYKTLEGNFIKNVA